MFESCSLGTDNSQLTTMIPLIVLVVLSIVMKRRKSEKTPQEIASSLFSDINNNQRIVEGFTFQGRPKKLQLGSWQRNNAKLDFLESSLRSSLASTFRLSEDFNMQIESAKTYQSSSYLEGISVDKLKRSMEDSKQGLEDWIKSNMQQAGPDAGRRGCMGG